MVPTSDVETARSGLVSTYVADASQASAAKGKTHRMMGRRVWIAGLVVQAVAAVGSAQPALDYTNSREIVAGRTAVFHSRTLNSDLQLSVRLPAGYEETSARYPVLLSLEFFDLAVGVVSTMCRGDYIPDMIVISIEGIGSDLYIPSPSTEGYGGDAEKFLRVIRDELLPVVDSTYRTEPYRILFGSSWAGVFTAYALLVSPETINAALASGPWLTYDGDQRYLLGHVANWTAGHDYSHNYLFFSGGNQPEIASSLEEFAALLGEHASAKLAWTYDPMLEEDHYTLRPRTLLAGLRSLFAARREIPDSVAARGREAIQEYTDQVNTHFGYEIGLSQGALSTKGWELYSSGETDRAIEVMKLGVELRPLDAGTVYGLGRLMQLTGDLEGAKGNYEKALTLLKPSQTVLRGSYEHKLNQVTEELNAKVKKD